MKGLLVKEIFNMRIYYRTILILVAFFSVIGLIQQSADSFIAMISGIGVMLTLMCAINSMSYDAASKWDCYALSMPVRRRDIVAAKYIFSIGIGAAFILFGLLAMAVIHLIFPSEESGSSAAAILSGIFGASIILLSIIFPLLYKFGVEKARFLIMTIALLPSLAIFLFSQLNISAHLFDFAALDWNAILIALPFVVLAIVAASYLLSVRIFEKKDL